MRIFIGVTLCASFLIAATYFSFGQGVFKYDLHGKRDPFIPLVDKEGNLLPEMRPIGSLEELNLQGILWNEKGESYAIISGTVLRVGDALLDYKVIKIEQKGVVLTRAGEEVTINLHVVEEE